MTPSPLLVNSLDKALPNISREVQINVGHSVEILVKEPLQAQVVSQRIDMR
jgi:hypothetical protein